LKKILDVYLQDSLIGTLRQHVSGQLSFCYDATYIEKSANPISISLPLQSEPFNDAVVRPFFSGLLPDESVRERLAKLLGVSEKNPFSLLLEIGGDCAGALSLFSHGEKKSFDNNDIEILDNEKLKSILELIKRRPMLAGDDGYRLSLAGAQDKLAVGFDNGQVVLLKGNLPTTHILKPLINGVKDSAHNELFCMKLAGLVGINVPSASLHFVNGTSYYLVERYDRFIDSMGATHRIHQEDFCQALAISPENKYEREGGPSVASCMKLITDYSATPALDQIKFLNLLIFNFLIGNGDAHGKNVSFLYKNKKPVLAPAYDLLSTSIYSDLSTRMAMKIGGKYNPEDVFLRHFLKEAAHTKNAELFVKKQIHSLSQKIILESEKLKKQLISEGISSEVFDEIINVINVRSEKLK
jgi:serine/threonine-protein kinase HipA